MFFGFSQWHNDSTIETQMVGAKPLFNSLRDYDWHIYEQYDSVLRGFYTSKYITFALHSTVFACNPADIFPNLEL